MQVITFLIGMFIGAVLGFLVLALMCAGDTGSMDKPEEIEDEEDE